jgi:hypothetical protein
MANQYSANDGWRNEPIFHVDMDWTDLGFTPEQAERIDAESLDVVWSTRPCGFVWWHQDAGEYRLPMDVTPDDHRPARTVHPAHYAAGATDELHERGGRETIQDRWNQYDAFPVRMVTMDDLRLIRELRVAAEGYDLADIIDVYGDDPVEFLRQVADMRIVTKRAR